MVEYKAEFLMLKPKNMANASGVLRYDAPNRGNILTLLNPTATPSDAVYLERGYVMLYSAWQGDVPKSTPARLTVTVPVAKNKDGATVNRWLSTGFLAASATTNETAWATYKVVRGSGMLVFDNQARV